MPTTLLTNWSFANATNTAVTAVIGPVGPEHCILVPPRIDATEAMIAADIIPAKAPLPDKIPNAAPRLSATKLTVRAATIFCKIT